MTSSISATPDPRIRYINVSDIEPNPFQPRQVFDEEEMEKLVASLKQHGVLQSILVRSMGEGFQLIAGERRWRAAKKAGFKTIPAIIREVDDMDALVLAEEENENRAIITDRDRALRLKKLWETWEAEGKNPSYRSIAAFLKKDKNWVRDRFKTLEFHDDVIGMLERNENVLTVAKEINAVPSRDRRAGYIAIIDAGGSRGEVLKMMEQDRQQDEEHKAKMTAIVESQKAPDKFTQQQQKAFAQTGSGITLGRALTPHLSSNRDVAKREIPAAIERIETWAPHTTREERARYLERIRAILEQD